MIKYTKHESNTAEISIRLYIGVNMVLMYEKKEKYFLIDFRYSVI